MLIANILGITLFFFFLWKRLKDDYHYEKIFNLGFFVLLGLVIGSVVSVYFFKEYWFWTDLFIVSVFFVLNIIRQKMKFFETLEALIISLLPWMGFAFLSDSISKSSLSSFLLFWITLIVVFFFFLLDSQYRKFTWYKSGRVGFAGVVTGFAFFISRIILYLIYPKTISFIPNFEIYLSATFVIVFFLLTYKLFISKE